MHVLQKGRPLPPNHFRFFCPTKAYKSDATGSQDTAMRIAGVISTDDWDSQEEKVFQRGLNFKYFLGKRGTFNNDHKPGALHIVGVPQEVRRFSAGDRLPDGKIAKTNCTWAEGHFVNSRIGRDMFDQAVAMQRIGRPLGFSIEGLINKRVGPSSKMIASADIHHVAITAAPVNDKTIALASGLAKSMTRFQKALETRGPDGEMSPLTRQDLDPKLISMAAGSPITGRKRPQKGRNDPIKTARKSTQTFDRLKSVYEELPHASVDFALCLAALLDRTA